MDLEAVADPLDVLQAKSDSSGWNGRFEYAATFARRELDAVLALWREKAKGGIPARSDFGARDLKDVLTNLWMVEEIAVGGALRYRYRRIGTAIAAAFGDMTGKFLDEALPPDLQLRWITAASALLRCSRPVRMRVKVDLPQADYLHAESFHAPLLDAAGKPGILMCVSYFSPARG